MTSDTTNLGASSPLPEGGKSLRIPVKRTFQSLLRALWPAAHVKRWAPEQAPMTRQSLQTQSLGLVGWLVATFAAGSVGAIASARAATFYGQLFQPNWAPPAGLFGPVWSVLYIFMAVAVWLVWRERGFRGTPIALWLYVIQLVANALWTWLFFVLHLGATSMAEIVVLWLLIAATIFSFWPVHRLAALLLAPYLVWVGFASALTLSLWRLNPAVLG